MAAKVGTAYVEIKGDFGPLNAQIARMGGISAQASSSFSRSMKLVSGEAEAARRRVAALSREISGIGVASRASSREAVASLRQIEAAANRTRAALQRVERAQYGIASSRPGRGGGGRGATAPAPHPNVAQRLVPMISEAAIQANVEAVVQRSFASGISAGTAGVAADPKVRGSLRTGFVGLGKSIGYAMGAEGVLGGLSTALSEGGKTHGFGDALHNFSIGFFRQFGIDIGKTTGEEFAENFEKQVRELIGAGGIGVQSIITPEIEERARKTAEAKVGPPSSVGGHALGVPAFEHEYLKALSGIMRSVKAHRASAKELFSGLWEDMGPNERVFAKKLRGALVQSDRLMRHSGVRLPEAAIKADPQSAQQSAKRLVSGFTFLKRGIGTNMTDINRVVQRNMRVARVAAAGDSGTLRRLTAANFRAAATAIRKEMDRSGDHTKAGWKRIRELTRNAELIKPSQKQARAFGREWARGMDQSKKITKDGIRDMISEAKKMPAPMRRVALETWLEQIKQAKNAKKITGDQFRDLRSRMLSEFGMIQTGGKQKSKGFADGVIGNVARMVNTTSSALSIFRDNVNIALAKFGVKGLEFTLKMVQSAQSRQTGGAIVPGSGEGDRHRTSLPVGSFVLNKRATAAFGFRSGGQVPVMLEPGERTFMPHEVRRVGLGNLEHLNRAVPRFQSGGGLGIGPEPHMDGPEPLRSAGQHGIHKVYKAGQRYVRKHAAPPRVRRMLAFAEREASQGYPYVYGGGHSILGLTAGEKGYDCSGFVSAILGAGNFITAPKSVAQGVGLYTLGEAGPGKFVTWGVRGSSGQNAHTMIEVTVAGKHHFFESGGTAGGASEVGGWDGAFQYRHIPGFQAGGAVMPPKARQALARYGSEAMQPGSPHFVGWGYQKGGGVKGIWAGTSIDRTYPRSDGYHGATLPFYVAAALGEWAGLPGVTMAQIGKSENSLHPGTDISDPPGRSYGWLAINDHFNNVTSAAMRNPILAILKAKKIVGGGLPNSSIWHATKYVTGYDLHYDGDPTAIARHVGGSAAAEDAKGKPLPKGAKYKLGKRGKKAPHSAKHGWVPTERLSFSPLPKTPKGCEDELKERREQLVRFQAALRENDDPAVKKALQANINKLKTRIKELRGRRVQLVRRGRLERITGEFAKAEELRNEKAEFAEQKVELEPVEPDPLTKDWIEHTLQPYVDNVETTAYEDLLGSEGSWRNTILGAEGYVEHTEIPGWKQQIEKLKDRIQGIEELKKAHPQAWAKKRDEIPGLHAKIKALRATIESTQTQTLPEWEGSLGELQGLGRSHEIKGLSGEPTGEFGGSIFQTQKTIHELGLKVKEALKGVSSSTDDSELVSLTQEKLLHEQQRNAISEAAFSTFSQFTSSYPVAVMPPYGGKAHTGAIVPGPPSSERTMVVKGGEGIFTPEQMAAMGTGSPGDVKVHVHGDIVSSHPDPVQVMIGDRRFAAAVQKAARAGRGIGIPTPGGARR